MTTYGEDRVHQLVKKLPNDYYGFQEPHLPGSKNAYQNPDYVIVCARMGVVVVEIKDYKHIASTQILYRSSMRTGQFVRIAHRYGLPATMDLICKSDSSNSMI